MNVIKRASPGAPIEADEWNKVVDSFNKEFKRVSEKRVGSFEFINRGSKEIRPFHRCVARTLLNANSPLLIGEYEEISPEKGSFVALEPIPSGGKGRVFYIGGRAFFAWYRGEGASFATASGQEFTKAERGYRVLLDSDANSNGRRLCLFGGYESVWTTELATSGETLLDFGIKIGTFGLPETSSSKSIPTTFNINDLRRYLYLRCNPYPSQIAVMYFQGSLERLCSSAFNIPYLGEQGNPYSFPERRVSREDSVLTSSTANARFSTYWFLSDIKVEDVKKSEPVSFIGSCKILARGVNTAE